MLLACFGENYSHFSPLRSSVTNGTLNHLIYLVTSRLSDSATVLTSHASRNPFPFDLMAKYRVGEMSSRPPTLKSGNITHPRELLCVRSSASVWAPHLLTRTCLPRLFFASNHDQGRGAERGREGDSINSPPEPEPPPYPSLVKSTCTCLLHSLLHRNCHGRLSNIKVLKYVQGGPLPLVLPLVHVKLT